MYFGLRLRLNCPSGHKYTINVPPHNSNGLTYNGSLGHKVNHSFEPNSFYTLFDSPRYGLVQAVKTLRDVTKGEELFANYDYKIDSLGQPKWYRDLYRSVLANKNETKALEILQRIDDQIMNLDKQELNF